MKKVLSAIGKFFLAIINWVKNTAWVQPLLIVGGIFGLIMSIKPISNWIGEITNVESESKFYDGYKTDYDKLEEKIKATGEDTNKTLIVFYISEDNDGNCANCIAAEKTLENFFALNHSEYTDKRNYEFATLDINSDEFLEDEVDKEEDLKDIRDHIELFGMQFVFEEMPSSYKANGTIDSAADDPMSTPCIARFEDGQCVGVYMGYSQANKDEFTKFCFYDPNTDFEEKFN